MRVLAVPRSIERSFENIPRRNLNIGGISSEACRKADYCNNAVGGGQAASSRAVIQFAVPRLVASTPGPPPWLPGPRAAAARSAPRYRQHPSTTTGLRMSNDTATLAHLCRLARLRPAPDEQELLAHDLARTLALLDELAKAPLDG